MKSYEDSHLHLLSSLGGGGGGGGGGVDLELFDDDRDLSFTDRLPLGGEREFLSEFFVTIPGDDGDAPLFVENFDLLNDLERDLDRDLDTE